MIFQLITIGIVLLASAGWLMLRASPETCRRRLPGPLRMRVIVGSLMGLNAVMLVGAFFFMWFQSPALAQETNAAGKDRSQQQGRENPGGGGTAVGAALAAGLAAIGAGIGVGLTGAAAIGAITEKPEVLGRTLIFVGLAEGIAIYGLIIAFMLLTGALGGGG